VQNCTNNVLHHNFLDILRYISNSIKFYPHLMHVGKPMLGRIFSVHKNYNNILKTEQDEIITSSGSNVLLWEAPP
jgi:hypothetical protein